MSYMNEADLKLFNTLHGELRKHASWANAYGLDRNASAGALVTDLMLAVEGDEIRFVTAAVDLATRVTRVAIITRKSLVLGQVESASEGLPAVEVTVESLGRIRALKPHGRQNAMVKPDWVTDWPDQVSITIVLDDDREVLLPYEHVNDETATLRELFVMLRDRMTSGTAGD